MTHLGLLVPRRIARLSVVAPGRLARQVASEGGSVREHDLVFSLEDGGQAIRTEMARIDAESTVEVELARARWDRARRNLERLANLYGADDASSKEYTDASSDARIAQLELERAKLQHELKDLAYRRERAVLDLMRVQAPFPGVILEYEKEVGETVNENEPVVTLVQLDPLEVLIDLPINLASSAQIGDQWLVHRSEDANQPRTGTVTWTGGVADGGSQTCRVKLIVPNPDGTWIAGAQVVVEVPSEPWRASEVTDRSVPSLESPVNHEIDRREPTPR